MFSKSSKSKSASSAAKTVLGPKERRAIQEAALKALPPNNLYIVLWITGDQPQADRFHWGFYFHQDERGGTKYHIKNLGAGWIADHGRTGALFKSAFLCCVI